MLTNSLFIDSSGKALAVLLTYTKAQFISQRLGLSGNNLCGNTLMNFVKLQRSTLSSISVLLIGGFEGVFALPASVEFSLKSLSVFERSAWHLKSCSSFHAIYVQYVHSIAVGVGVLIGLGALFIIIHRHIVMPKSVRERRLERDFKSSPMGLSRGKGRSQSGETPDENRSGDINRIWLDAVQKGPSTGLGGKDDDKKEACGIHNQPRQHRLAGNVFLDTYPRTSLRHPTLPPLTLANDLHGPLIPEETHDFGENPNYHQDGFQYSVPHLATSLSTPPSPFSSRFCSGNIRKLKGHKRSKSLPSPYQTLHASMDLKGGFLSTSNFPFPTLRPLAPPEVMSTPGTPALVSDNGEESSNLTGYRYLSQYPRAQGNQRAHSVPLPGVPMEIAASTCDSPTVLDVVQEGPTEIQLREAEDKRPDTVFQPVMIFEQGRSVTGQKWRRKVTVFRSEILERLQKEGLVIR